MRTRLLMSPPWVQGAVVGVGGGAVYGGVFIVMSLLIGSRQTSWAQLVAIGVFGAVVAAAAILASRTGPVPDDPRVRSAATEPAADNAARAYRRRWAVPAIVVVGAVPAVVVQVMHPSVVSAVYLVALVMMGVSGLTSRRRIDRRREVLACPPGF